jgi:hypothetical protein
MVFCGACLFRAPRIGCATDIKKGAPQICLHFNFFKNIIEYIVYSKKYAVYSRIQRYISVTQKFTETEIIMFQSARIHQ